MTATTNGTSSVAAMLPVDSFREAASHLRRPFTVEAVRFKPQSVTKSGKTLCVAYIDARLVVERLNLVCPHLWSQSYESLGGGLMWCHLTIGDITRTDVGEGKGKALVSDALKRAAVQFGIGVSLYAIPTMFLAGEVRYLAEGSSELRDLKGRYRLWLEGVGIRAFGQPLDHGDADEAQGDREVDVPEGVDRATGEITARLPDRDVSRLAGLVKGLVDNGTWTAANAKTNLVACGASDTSSVKAALKTLDAAAAGELEAAMKELTA